MLQKRVTVAKINCQLLVHTLPVLQIIAFPCTHVSVHPYSKRVTAAKRNFLCIPTRPPQSRTSRPSLNVNNCNVHQRNANLLVFAKTTAKITKIWPAFATAESANSMNEMSIFQETWPHPCREQSSAKFHTASHMSSMIAKSAHETFYLRMCTVFIV